MGLGEWSMVGKVTTEGDRAMRSALAREYFNLDGRGIKIGVISDSFDAFFGAATDVQSGDLPGRQNPNGYTKPVRVLKDNLEIRRVSDEGRAMLQIIHDVAPGAELLFHTSGDTETTFAQAVRALAQAGADVIVDDIGFPNSLFFQDGVAAQAVNEVEQQGVVYFSAAGNDGDRSYTSSFRPGGTFSFRGATYQAHDFDPGAGIDLFQDIEIPKDRAISLILNWDQPVGQVANEVDLFLLENAQLPGAGGVGLRDASIILPGSDEPIQQFFYQAPRNQTVYLVIAHKVNPGSPPPGEIKWINFTGSGDDRTQFQYVNANNATGGSSTIFGQPNAAGAIAVGAIDYTLTPAFGSKILTPERFSSIGQTSILFDAQGNRLAVPIVRSKPEIIAPNGVATTVDISFTRGIDFSPFFGTSAAAPHAAAVAALMLQRAGGRKRLTPSEILATLQATGLPTTATTEQSASVLIQANTAVLQSAQHSQIGTEGRDRLQGTRSADNLMGMAGDDVLNGRGGFDWLLGGDGRDRLRGDKGNDYLLGNENSDIIIGGNGNDTLVGNQGNDTLIGGQGNDRIQGEQGRDRLQGDTGENQLWGGKGRDRFVLHLQGMAILEDFQLGQDRIVLPRGISFEALQVVESDRGAAIELKDKRIAELVGISSAELGAVDFLES